ncbi:hypothetical protein [Bradyrhizobium manausense]|uniref:hypothetical protein n=1 Tax=Bradyrhizobium manausense TaxID=989370 RepID=UPI001BACD3C0|nr:hypothetical protein [Bradyrhizobium manausense]MBR0726345.1 hypothetical protein [Bradyrhizobium manausense]
MQGDVRYWFPAKRYGWGWGPPITWQGWATLVAFLILIAIGAALIPTHTLVGFIAYAVVLTVLFAGVCWWKGEPPRWQWGGE